MNRFTEQLRAERTRLADDPHRPLYHFLPASNWMNDPNGLIQWDGRYHLFYQSNPDALYIDKQRWGHAVSEDLVHWSDLPVALAPTPGGYDEDGCWSGCAVDDDGTPVILYTGVVDTDAAGRRDYRQVQCVAVGSSDLLEWGKHPRNPVISAPPKDLDVMGFRDPSVWKEGDTWYAIVGSGIRGAGGAALLYRSPNLIDWEYLYPLYVGDKDATEPVWTGTMWECPEFFRAGDRHVLVVSVHDGRAPHYSAYFTGTYADGTFTPEARGILDPGGTFYAPQSMVDDRGRRLVWGWLREDRGDAAVQRAGWAGAMSLPRVLSVRPNGLLRAQPVPELEALRGGHHRLERLDVTPDGTGVLDGARGDSLEISAEFRPGSARQLGIGVRCSPGGEEETLVYYDRDSERLGLDRERSSLSADVHRDPHSAVLALSGDEPLRLRVFLDRSVVEVFANERAVLTERIYPARSDSLGLRPFARGGRAGLESLDVWEMEPIWAAK